MGTRGLLGAHLGDIGDQAPEAEQGLRHSFNTGPHLLVCALVGDKSTGHTSPAGGRRGGKGWPRGVQGSGHGPALPPSRSRSSQQHEGGQQQEGHESAALTGHGLVLGLHTATAAPATAATAEAEAGGGHSHEVEACDHSAHHVARLVPHHLAGQRGVRGSPSLPRTQRESEWGESRPSWSLQGGHGGPPGCPLTEEETEVWAGSVSLQSCGWNPGLPLQPPGEGEDDRDPTLASTPQRGLSWARRPLLRTPRPLQLVLPGPHLIHLRGGRLIQQGLYQLCGKEQAESLGTATALALRHPSPLPGPGGIFEAILLGLSTAPGGSPSGQAPGPRGEAKAQKGPG